MAKYILVRDGANKILELDGEVLATWDKHDSYEYVVECVQGQRLKEGDELIEREAEPAPEPKPKAKPKNAG